MKRDINYLKEKFETNDTPEQADFQDWMDSYWHKDEKIPMDNLNIDVSTKADRTAENLSAENIASWKAKLNEPSQITIETSSNIHTNELINGMKMHGKNMVVKNGNANIELQCLQSSEQDFMCTITKAGTGSITIKNGSGVSIKSVDYTNVLNGGVGSTAKLQRIGNDYYLRIFNT
ncbi:MULTISPECIES: hypothetical protein [Chryseobacterium]|uniref:Uncharacterized protein n=1 Tax=Chryseobacterium camelliae TaxID=1265445 RepID=A0ABU0TFI1_9FLAO|nr:MULTISPECIES: hypothetical protein [Chryseobacterium]MDT3406385.1 hypothetical protein [Pseudacidovorax intermedius]MDQ1095815.1 hypothetical protein [Chryseobacterium camelliae]MDQ1099752.1 hypothetical protein [Chryseobacterium sp. SORGH_AS_1048]MDR6087100.1 hypothetical protein [Chryseobacterium sp. SORGH_AS_0909]MDR6131473.1 hypothetical protein [Chryseobacterium sp. SORGH_AS_1175]